VLNVSPYAHLDINEHSDYPHCQSSTEATACEHFYRNGWAPSKKLFGEPEFKSKPKSRA
jgi:hypothetical protein